MRHRKFVVTGADLRYFERCRELDLLRSPFLEVGAYQVSDQLPTLWQHAKRFGVEHAVGVDLEPGPGVAIIADFSLDPERFRQSWQHSAFQTVAIFNVLEHVFDPVTVLRNCLHCTLEGGTLLVLVPVVWPIHNFPRDYARLLPDWFMEFGRKTELQLVDEAFLWVSQFGLHRVSQLTSGEIFELPSSQNLGRSTSPLRYWASRVLHRLFNTYGRSHMFAHAALGAAYRVTPERSSTG